MYLSWKKGGSTGRKINLLKILLNRNFIFSASVIIGLAAGDVMGKLSFLNMPILMIIMTISLTETDFSAFRDIKKSASPVAAGIVFNYILTFFAVIAVGKLFPLGESVWAGLVLAAATPPGLAIVPFTALLGGNLFYASTATLSAFLATLFLMPWLTASFTGSKAVSFLSILNLMILLVIIPLILGVIFRRIGFADIAKKIHGPAVNLGFGIIFIVIFGVNRIFLVTEPGYIIKLLIIFTIVVFGIAYGMKYALKNKNISREDKISIIIVSTIKNSVFGATAGLSLLGPEGALPGTVMSFVILVYLIFIDKIIRPETL